MCEDAPCCGCCPSAELWNPHPSDQEAWEDWMEELKDPDSGYYDPSE